MKFNLNTFIFPIICLSIYSCDTPNPPMDLTSESIIPRPVKINATGTSFIIDKKTKVIADKSIPAIDHFVSLINRASVFKLVVQTSNSEPAKNKIVFSLDNKLDLNKEGYQLTITEEQILLSAKSDQGIFNGIQTLRQLLPASIEKATPKKDPIYIASGTITDQPDYHHRGAMLDVSRHFFKLEDVKRYIDLLAQYKINALHLHLSDDQGWRIEIKSWPNLTKHGGSTAVGGDSGGFFTQEDYKEIVNYAAARFMTIIPEIDMPGHTNAALSSYPELNCDGKAPKLYTGIDVGFSTLCTAKEITYTFVDDVIRELADITPGPYIHIGGDESLVTELKDYIPFIERVSQMVAKYGKKVIGWDEIAHANLPPNSTVQYWHLAKNAQRGVAQNAKVLMTPAHKTYLDMQYDSTTHLGLHWAAYIEIDSAYMWEPTKMVDGVEKEHILGIESPLWSETIKTIDDIEYMAFPRIICHAEIGWTPYELREWEDFKVRLGKQKDRLDNQEIDYYASKLVPWQSEKENNDKQ